MTRTAREGPVTENENQFMNLGLNPDIVRALDDLGYEAPTPIQARTIPPLLEGRDVLGQAQTGTGKTAAFALPILSTIDLTKKLPQALILAPTRELAIQVAEAIRSYSAHLDRFSVLPIYGGSGYDGQLRALRRGVHVVVGTPGRVMDHMRRGTLKLDDLDTLVLDEADEMLRMGFLDDVKWVLDQTPPERRVALFSATMPRVIRSIATQYLNDPVEVRIKQEAATAATVRQRVRIVPHHHKVEVLTRVLESEPYDAMLVFCRTRNGATEVCDKLRARGVAAEALSGDVPQRRRQQLVDELKDGRVDVLVATDVAARGLDVDRLTHVVNFDAPHGLEAYVHRIGRTGRAGRTGEAILFVTPRERHIIKAIERANNEPLERLLLPTTDEVNARRLERYKEEIASTIGTDAAAPYTEIVRSLVEDGHDPVDVGAAIAAMGQGDEPLLLDAPPLWEREAVEWRNRRNNQDRDDRGKPRKKSNASNSRGRNDGHESHIGHSRRRADKELFRIEVGADDGVRPGNIVGAIASEAGITGRVIGRIQIESDHSFVELPAGMPDTIFQHLHQRTFVCGKRLQLSRAEGVRLGEQDDRSRRRKKPAKSFKKTRRRK